MWTSSVVCGLIGVMLTILLFKGPAKLQASTKPIAVVPPPIPLFASPAAIIPVPLFAPFNVESPFDGRLMRTTLDQYWNQTAQTTLVSTSPELINHNIVQPIRDGWNTAQRHAANALPSIYRQTATLVERDRSFVGRPAFRSPGQLRRGRESRPAIVVTRDLPAEISPSEPMTYSLMVQNRGAEILEQIVVTEKPANLDRVQ